MRGELDNLTQLFRSLLPAGTAAPASLKLAIGETLIQCPVYRFYGARMPLSSDDAAALEKIFARIRSNRPELLEGLRMLEEVLLEQPAKEDEDYNKHVLHFYQRLMQFSGPLLAKGVEDTLMYTYGRFIGHNDVGDAPESFGISKEVYHKAMLERQEHWPLSINTTSTHDTKRGEDARAMLNVLTDVPQEWARAVAAWQKLNAPLKLDGMPDAKDEYFLYQTFFATYPFNESAIAGYADRVKEYMQKALREGKRNSDWAAPNERYEAATANFIDQLLDGKEPFMETFAAFRDGLTEAGMLQALAQVAIKLCAPGVPDVYQGTELWDLSLVDPDNRSAVDYAIRASLSADVKDQSLAALWINRWDGHIKAALTRTLLQLRRDDEELFAKGRYIPLRVTGRYAPNVFAFARRFAARWIIVAVPLHIAAMASHPLELEWADTAIQLPDYAPADWQHLLDRTEGSSVQGVRVSEIFSAFPLAVLRMEQPANERSAGVLMAVSSLPSDYGIGDLGPGTRKFAQTLSKAGQRWWQLLPLNPVSPDSGWSPYSSISTLAGNTLLISPEDLAADGLITDDDLRRHKALSTNSVNYDRALHAKNALLQAAFLRYRNEGSQLRSEIESFEAREAFWLDDFALFVVIKRTQENAPWYEWADEFRRRDAAALQKIQHQHADEIAQVKWEQAIFAIQWLRLRDHCNALGIRLIGDLPFYASYDSADVWSHSEIFSLNEDGAMQGVAGVPPDYFSETGQLWGMPTFRWDILKRDGYTWWIDRLRKNLQLYDLLRIDHFRALAAYWEMPAGEETAVNGQWKEGPGTHFFDAIREAFGGLPFIAEDLGDKMEDVYKLRDAVGLPGMKVMQFAFGANISTAVDAPHNYGQNFISYTGTHDNNTTLGWFREEVTKQDRQRLEMYTNTRITEKNVNEIMAKLSYGSVARTVVLPMQDVLHLDERARMNMPGAAAGNWSWRMLPDAFGAEQIEGLLKLTRFYNRI